MFYTIYKITNLINNKFYIGKHQTNNVDDEYMGSGKLITAAIKKYGANSFRKEILHIFDNEKDMNNAEKNLVILSEDSYNLCPGGNGGFGYINNNKLKNNKTQREKASINISKLNASRTKEHFINSALKSAKKRKENGTQHIGSTDHLNTDESIRKRKETMNKNGHSKGEKNSQFGKPRSEETKRKISETLKNKRMMLSIYKMFL